MAPTESDIEQLEELLDGALPGDEAEALRSRIHLDPALADVMDRLRADRAARRALFAALEPDDAHADVLTQRIRAAAQRQRTWQRATRTARVGSAVAACLLIGFLGGWLGRDHALSHATPTTPHPIASVASPHAGPTVQSVVAYQVVIAGEDGRVTAVQNFDSLDKAQEFADDLGRWQDRQKQLQQGGAVLVADRF